jgi:uncharacterized protein DUF4333
MTTGTGTLTRGQRSGLLAAAPAAVLALAACGASGFDTAALAKDIRARLDQHPGWAVRSVRCPGHARKAKGVVIHCSATLRDGRVVRLRATQLDDKGSIHLVANEIFADNVERAVVASVPGTHASAQAVCPNFEPVVIGNAFTCRLARAGPYTRARVTIVDGDGGFRLGFS